MKDSALKFDVRCMSAANTPEGDVWYCDKPIEHEGVHAYQPWHRNQVRLCRCADEVRCEMRKQITLLADSNALLSEQVEDLQTKIEVLT